ncbi:hypothetical protein [Acidovorax delafieldii]|nr:hypothetical protein [Acidovorax delafieldii]
MYEDDFAPQADSQPAQVEVADAMADSQYLAGVSAGWNAANADDPNAALQKLHESRAGYLKPLRAARASADSQPAPVRGIEDCPELNMSNYGELEVGRLNDWAIRASAEIDRLSAARAPADSVTAPAAFQRALDIRTAQGWKLGGDKVPVLYTDTINGKQVCRDDIWLCTTAAFSTPPAQAADSVREDAARWREHVGKLDALVAYCPTCCQGFVAKQDMTRDEVLFACGKAVGQSGAKRLREALDLAVGHIDMDALRISHCKDAAAIDAARKQGGTA